MDDTCDKVLSQVIIAEDESDGSDASTSSDDTIVNASDFDSFTYAELWDYCADRGIEMHTRASRSRLIDSLLKFINGT